MSEYQHDDHPEPGRGESTRVLRDRRRQARRSEREREAQEWSREDFFRDLRRASRRKDETPQPETE